MANSDSDDRNKAEGEARDFDEGLGDDWESAFQAEEFMFSPEEGEGDSFFLETTGPSTAYEFTPPDEHDLADLPDLDQDAGRAAPADPAEPAAEANTPLPEMPRAERWRRLRTSFSDLPLVHRIALGGITLLVALLALVLLWPAERQPAPTAGPPAAGPMAAAPPTLPAAGPSHPENIRRTWRLAPFILPVAADKPSKEPAFLEVDLSLVLVLATDGKLPMDKKIMVRDLIYRYYRQQPLARLRRFALAREEMNRSLLAWLRQHWPKAPIETVIFDRYQLT